MTTSPNPYRRFSLSLRDVGTILAACGIVASGESIREWGLRFGWPFASTLKRRRPKPGRMPGPCPSRGPGGPAGTRWTTISFCRETAPRGRLWPRPTISPRQGG